MLIIQVGICFIFWIGLVFGVSMNASKLRPRLERIPRGFRVAAGPLLMILGAVALLGGVSVIAAFHGLQAGGLKPWAWILVALIGVLFVGLQAISSLIMVSIAAQNEPEGSGQASDGRITDRNSHESKTSARS